MLRFYLLRFTWDQNLQVTMKGSVKLRIHRVGSMVAHLVRPPPDLHLMGSISQRGRFDKLTRAPWFTQSWPALIQAQVVVFCDVKSFSLTKIGKENHCFDSDTRLFLMIMYKQFLHLFILIQNDYSLCHMLCAWLYNKPQKQEIYHGVSVYFRNILSLASRKVDT